MNGIAGIQPICKFKKGRPGTSMPLLTSNVPSQASETQTPQLPTTLSNHPLRITNSSHHPNQTPSPQKKNTHTSSPFILLYNKQLTTNNQQLSSSTRSHTTAAQHPTPSPRRSVESWLQRLDAPRCPAIPMNDGVLSRWAESPDNNPKRISPRKGEISRMCIHIMWRFVYLYNANNLFRSI